MRGVIDHRERFRQVLRFDGMNYGTITPTDIDAFYDFGNHVFVHIEIKYMEAEMPTGQRLALERLCDCAEEAGRTSFVFVGAHKVTDPQNDIYLKDTIVSEYRHKKTWNKSRCGTTMRHAIDWVYDNYVKN